MKLFYKYSFAVLCLFFLSSCSNEDIKPKKLLGKWSLSSDYYYEERGGVKRYEGEEKYKPAEEFWSLHFTSKDEVLYRWRDYVSTRKYTYTESTKRLTIIDTDGYSGFYELISLDSKQLKLKHSEYSDYAEANVVSEYTFVKL